MAACQALRNVIFQHAARLQMTEFFFLGTAGQVGARHPDRFSAWRGFEGSLPGNGHSDENVEREPNQARSGTA
jgi:hypothetical protein